MLVENFDKFVGVGEGTRWCTQGVGCWIRPYCAESTASRPISEVKLRQASLVLGWETTRESGVPYPFSFHFLKKRLALFWFCLGGDNLIIYLRLAWMMLNFYIEMHI